jgi:hypothetical protein
MAGRFWHLGSADAAQPGKMNIGADYSFLSVERVGVGGPGLVWRLQAALLGPGWKFTADHERLKVVTEKGTLKQLADFAARKTRRLEMALLHGGWLRLARHRGDRIVVRYRVGHASAGAALEGKVCLTGEPAERFCQDLKGRV